jgi:hypothetical protein
MYVSSICSKLLPSRDGLMMKMLLAGRIDAAIASSLGLICMRLAIDGRNEEDFPCDPCANQRTSVKSAV